MYLIDNINVFPQRNLIKEIIALTLDGKGDYFFTQLLSYYEGVHKMDKPFIAEKLKKSSKVTLGNRTITINEYVPNITESQKEVAEIKVKSALMRAFSNKEYS